MVIFALALFFLLGYCFKTYYSYSEDQIGQVLSRIVLNITLPATVFFSASNSKGVSQSFLLTIAAISIQLFMYGIFRFIARKKQLEKDTECVFVTTPLASNVMLFMSPFFYLSYGDVGLNHLILYDLGNSVTIFLASQPIYKFANQKNNNFLASLKLVFKSVPIWAFFIGIIFAQLGLSIPALLQEPLQIIKEVNTFLPMFLLGIYFRPSLDKIGLVSFTVLFRATLGILIGIGVSFFFTDPMDKVTIMMCAAAPIGVINLIFASEYKKDISYCSSIVSYSLLLGLLITYVYDMVFRAIGLV